MRCMFFQVLPFILRRTDLNEVIKRGISIANRISVTIAAIICLVGIAAGLVNNIGK